MFTAEDDRPNAAPVVVMSYRLWQQKYFVGGVRDRQYHRESGRQAVHCGWESRRRVSSAILSGNTPPDFFFR